MTSPRFTIIAGPNGAGKSTSAPFLIDANVPYINADEIAKGLSGDGKDIQAGRILLAEWDRLAAEKADFGIETTLASRSLAPKIKQLQASGYEFHLYFFWLPSVELSIARVAERVRRGGHNIPEETIRRRYVAGLSNFFEIYKQLAQSWYFYDRTPLDNPLLIAAAPSTRIVIYQPQIWHNLMKGETMKHNLIKETMSPYSSDIDRVQNAVRAATRAAILDHKLAGNPIATWRDGKVVWIQPEDIEIPEE